MPLSVPTTGPCRCWITCVSSCARVCWSPPPSPRTTWLPEVYARAPISPAERRAAASRCTRTSEKSAPSRASASCRSEPRARCHASRPVGRDGRAAPRAGLRRVHEPVYGQPRAPSAAIGGWLTGQSGRWSRKSSPVGPFSSRGAARTTPHALRLRDVPRLPSTARHVPPAHLWAPDRDRPTPSLPLLYLDLCSALLYLYPPLTPDAARSGPRSAPSRPTPPRCGSVGCTSPYGRSARVSRS